MTPIRRKSITLLWIHVYYDYMRSGFCEYRDKPYYFVESEDYRYNMHPLRDSTWKAHLLDHQKFREFVGTHWDGEDYGWSPERVNPTEEWHKYYDEKKELPDPEELPAIFCFRDENQLEMRRRKWIRRKDRVRGLRKQRPRSEAGIMPSVFI